jgi:hypothetical protein
MAFLLGVARVPKASADCSNCANTYACSKTYYRCKRGSYYSCQDYCEYCNFSYNYCSTTCLYLGSC